MRATEATIAVVDFEGTGAVPGYSNEPWQVGVVLLEAGEVRPGCAFESLLHVGDRPFNPHAPGRHTEVRDAMTCAPRLPDLWPELQPWISGRPLAAHGPATEKRFLNDAFPLHPLGPWIDTVKLARMAYPHHARHTLERLLDDLSLTDAVARIVPGRRPHDALYDAAGCAVLLAHLLHLPQWSGVSVDALTQARPVQYHRARRATGTAPGSRQT
jgi:DNA polymerase III epsilon subunit-like protein